MALTGEKKREWRRKNREKIAAYTTAWIAANPEKMEAQARRDREKRDRARADRLAADPDFAARQRHRERMESDPEYAAARLEMDAEREDERKRLLADRRTDRSKSVYRGDWTWRSVQKIADTARGHLRRQTAETDWDRRVQNITRGLRFMRSLTSSQTSPRKRKRTGWMAVAKLLANRLDAGARKATILMGDPKTAATRRALWKRRCHRIAGGLKKRRRVKTK